ncbi:MAG: hypothetical protein HY537_14445 [Deltaproteobacteria bacterium]|nr:hypothetical protein [Deltaproteobacteria bacterium]
MAMRYTVRRQTPNDLTDIRQRITDLDTRLGAPQETLKPGGLQKTVQMRVSPNRSADYSFATTKVGSAAQWTCHSVELVAEDERGMTELLQMLGLAHPKLSHLLSDSHF